MMLTAITAACCGNEPMSAQNRSPAPELEVTKKKPMSIKVPPKSPPAVRRFPHLPTGLPVDGFCPASHVGPSVHTTIPAPLIILLHGNFDRPEWQCEMWQEVADFYGWILCPRGIPTPWAAPADDRWMYRSIAAVEKEIDAGIAALTERYPDAIRTDETILVGFSLGAILAPALVLSAPGKYKYLYLIEGGADKLTAPRARALKKAGIRGIGLAMSTSKNRTAAKLAMKTLKKISLPAAYVNMVGAGHNYRNDFPTTGRASLMELLGLETSDAGAP